MADDWDDILEYREVEVTDNIENGHFAPGVDVEAPAGFGRSEYERMVEDLWGEGEVRAMTVLDRSLDFLDEAAGLTAESLEEIYDTTVSGEFDEENYVLGIFGFGLGVTGIGMAAALVPMAKVEKAFSQNLQSPLYTSSSTVYDNEAEIGEEESARIFYRENSDNRSIRFTGTLGETPDPEVVKDGLEYLERFEN